MRQSAKGGSVRSGFVSDEGRAPAPRAEEEALAVAREAVDVFRGLAKERPAEFEPRLAAALVNLSTRLCELGRREEALAAVQEAVGTYRGLAKERPGEF